MKKRMIVRSIFVVIMFFCDVAAAEDTSSRKFFGAFLESLRTQGYSGSVGMFHPRSVERVRSLVENGVRKDLEAKGDKSNVRILATPDDPTKLADLTDVELATRFFKWAESVFPGTKAMLEGRKVKVIGTVYEEETQTEIVVARVLIDVESLRESNEIEIFKMKKKEDGGWAMLLPDELVTICSIFDR